jgi:hypothetical protein
MASIDVDLDDYIDELSDSSLRAEFARRKLACGVEELLHQGYSALLAGRVADGITLIERALFPTHASREACLERYKRCT